MECGYEVPFSNEIEQRFVCPICLLVMRNPVQTACGHRFCNDCIKQVIPFKNTVLVCPIDKTFTKVSQMFPDLATEREILSLVVQCTNVAEMCPWRGELRDLDNHRKVCEKESIACVNGCDAKIKRLELEEHAATCSHRLVLCTHCQQEVIFSQLEDHNERCPKLPVMCQLCNEMLPRDVLVSHQDPKEGQCAKTIIQCPYNYVGCVFESERELMKNHTHAPNALHDHMELALKWMISQGRYVKELSQHILDVHEKSNSVIPLLLQNEKKNRQSAMELRDRNVTGKLHWKLKIGDLRQRAYNYTSSVFYTGCPGYKVQLSLNTDGPRDGNFKFTSFSLTLLAGDYDDNVIFPFNATCIIRLHDQVKCPPHEKEHLTSQLVVREVPRNSSGSNIHVDRIYKREISKYVRRPDLIGPSSRYLKNGCLHFEVTVIHSYYPSPESVFHSPDCCCQMQASGGHDMALTPGRTATPNSDSSTLVQSTPS